MVCSGGIRPRTVDHVGWLVLKGIPWLWRRGRDLLPYAAAIMWRAAKESWHQEHAQPDLPSAGPNVASASVLSTMD